MELEPDARFHIEGTILLHYHKKMFQKLGDVTLPQGVTAIGENAFAQCKTLTSIIIPETVTEIGNNAFSGCIALTSVTLPNTISSMGEGVFDQCLALRGFRFLGEETCACCGGPPHD